MSRRIADKHHCRCDDHYSEEEEYIYRKTCLKAAFVALSQEKRPEGNNYAQYKSYYQCDLYSHCHHDLMTSSLLVLKNDLKGLPVPL